MPDCPSDTRQPHLRIGVLVVAYNAANTLAQTLDRIPGSFKAKVDHVLIADDASQDETYEIGLAYRDDATMPLTILRHERNLGYGGNQKAGYAWAISHGLDIVVLLHGDGQYAPEVIEDVVQPLVDGTADAVFGSRMMVRGAARRGGMPIYKLVGNRILTTVQNRLTGLGLSEWHSGYRAYRVEALRNLPLGDYTNDFDFDTEVILGLHDAGYRIAEVPIPTYYGDEICHVNGLKYAKDVVGDVLRHRATRIGLGHGSMGVDDTAYELKPSAHSSHGVLLRWLDETRRGRVLDAGCSDGRFGAVARAMGHQVTGLDVVKHDGVADRLDEFVEADLNDPLPAEAGADYDVVVAGDVLEHVIDPKRLLTELAARTTQGGEILVSVPNFAHWYPRTRTALGLFDYDQRGPLDQGHVRFFTRRSFERLIQGCGLRIVERAVVGSPIDVLDRADAPTLATNMIKRAGAADRAATRVWPTMFGYQFLYRLERA